MVSSSQPRSPTVVLQQELRFLRKQQLEHQAQLQREQDLLEADPFDAEAQRKIEELIQQKNIEENFMAVSKWVASYLSKAWSAPIDNVVEI